MKRYVGYPLSTLIWAGWFHIVRHHWKSRCQRVEEGVRLLLHKGLDLFHSPLRHKSVNFGKCCMLDCLQLQVIVAAVLAVGGIRRYQFPTESSRVPEAPRGYRAVPAPHLLAWSM